MARGAVLDKATESLHESSVDFAVGCQKLQKQAGELRQQKFADVSARLNSAVKAVTGHEFHLESAQVNTLVGLTSFALGALVAKEKRTMCVLSKINNWGEKQALPPLTLVDATTLSSLKEENRLDSVEATYSHGISTTEDWRGQKWLHQKGYAKVPIHKKGYDWWLEENLTWVKTSHYLESRNNDGSFFRTYKNGGIQIRFGNGYEVYEGSFPERRKIVLNTGNIDCRAQPQGILSAVDSDLKSSLTKTGR
ncbi:MAG: hypothetical protein P4L53_00725 [Candidatus Obscuribacterales bacterium]|nr:hypothetical protein [Candidatus Obscuribacterales bacterium]